MLNTVCVKPYVIFTKPSNRQNIQDAAGPLCSLAWKCFALQIEQKFGFINKFDYFPKSLVAQYLHDGCKLLLKE